MLSLIYIVSVFQPISTAFVVHGVFSESESCHVHVYIYMHSQCSSTNMHSCIVALFLVVDTQVYMYSGTSE